MTKSIAVAGKGGTGKTTISALLIKLLSQKGVVLAVDGDPSSNLNMALGLLLEETVGNVREEMLEQVRGGSFNPGMAKQDYIDIRIREALVESDKIDLVAMGRPEGPGCYCAANNMLRNCLDRLAKNYDYAVVDCEAGLEHISRQTTRDVDILLIVSDPTIRGITTAARVKDLIGEIRTQVGRTVLVINRVPNGLSPDIKRAVEEAGLELLALLPVDPQLMELESTGRPVVELPPESPLQVGVTEIAKKLTLL